jgi:transposase-like protein
LTPHTRDREGTLAPVILGKRQRWLSDIDTVVLSPSSRGLTSGEISAHFAEVYGANVSKDTITRITELFEGFRAVSRLIPSVVQAACAAVR